MVVIRLSRGGSKKRPFYHVTVADRREPRNGRFIDRLGFFNPVARGQEERLRIDVEAVQGWVAKGAQVSPRVQKLIKEVQAALQRPPLKQRDTGWGARCDRPRPPTTSSSPSPTLSASMALKDGLNCGFA